MATVQGMGEWGSLLFLVSLIPLVVIRTLLMYMHAMDYRSFRSFRCLHLKVTGDHERNAYVYICCWDARSPLVVVAGCAYKTDWIDWGALLTVPRNHKQMNLKILSLEYSWFFTILIWLAPHSCLSRGVSELRLAFKFRCFFFCE
jgi:hypothetical protein